MKFVIFAKLIILEQIIVSKLGVQSSAFFLIIKTVFFLGLGPQKIV